MLSIRNLALGIVITAAAVAAPLSASAGGSAADSLKWPAFAGLNQAYTARAVNEAGGFRLEYKVAGQHFTKRVAVPAELWSKLKSDFKPHHADVVISPSGELSSVGVRQGGRELWITFDRSPAGKCVELIYPSGPGIEDLAVRPSEECGS